MFKYKGTLKARATTSPPWVPAKANPRYASKNGAEKYNRAVRSCTMNSGKNGGEKTASNIPDRRSGRSFRVKTSKAIEKILRFRTAILPAAESHSRYRLDTANPILHARKCSNKCRTQRHHFRPQLLRSMCLP